MNHYTQIKPYMNRIMSTFLSDEYRFCRDQLTDKISNGEFDENMTFPEFVVYFKTHVDCIYYDMLMLYCIVYNLSLEDELTDLYHACFIEEGVLNKI